MWLPANSCAQRACIAARPPATPVVVAAVKPRNVSTYGVLQHASGRATSHAALISLTMLTTPPLTNCPLLVQFEQLPPVLVSIKRPESGEPS